MLKNLFIILIAALVNYVSLGQQVGLASYYSDSFKGMKTASGEKYDPKKLTAAHKSLPIGTMIKVTNISNGKSVIVKINDRGPFVRDRILDLSKAAAIELGIIQSGYAKVRFTVVDDNVALVGDTLSKDPEDRFYEVGPVDPAVKMGYGVKLGSFDDPGLAFILSRDLKSKFNVLAYMQTAKVKKKTVYRIFVGNFASKKAAEELRETLKKDYPEAKVVSYNTFK